MAKQVTPEQASQIDVELTASKLGCRLLRNNSGAFTDEDGRVIRFGLGNISKKVNDQLKSSDLIGITEVVITPEMVGKKVGVFTAIEVKPESFTIKEDYREKSREWAQNNFIKWAIGMGAFGGFARNGEDLKFVINHFLNWLKQ